MELRQLAADIAELADCDALDRAQRAPGLIERAKGVLGRERTVAIYAATRDHSYEEVAEQLGISTAAVNKAITAYRRREGPS